MGPGPAVLAHLDSAGGLQSAHVLGPYAATYVSAAQVCDSMGRAHVLFGAGYSLFASWDEGVFYGAWTP